MKTLDMRGSPCPLPVVHAKKELEKTDAVIIVVDNIIAVQNLQKLADGKGYAFSFMKQDENFFEVTITKHDTTGVSMAEDTEVRIPADAYSEKNSVSGTVVFISADIMGRGSDELGRILLKGFIFSLTELPVPPGAVIFINSGVHLCIKGSNTLEDLRVLSGKGSKILACGTCLNYYALTDKLAAGEITDMYTITSYLSSAGRLIMI